MNTEEIVIGLIEDYKFAGLVAEKTEQRQVFLAILAFILVSKAHDNYLDKFFKESFKSQFKEDNEFKFSKPSHHALFDEIKHYYQQQNAVAISSFQNLKSLIENSAVNDISSLTALEIYDRTLQRLQKMNVADRISKTFPYDYFPIELAKFVVDAVDDKKQLNVNDPVSLDGRLTSMCCALTDTKLAAIVSDKQSPIYLNHMLTVAGVEESNTSDCNLGIAGKFDLSILLQPNQTKTAYAFDIEGLITEQLQLLNDDGLCIAFVRQGFLIGKLHQKFRRQLITAQNIKTIIELPTKLISPTYPSLFAMILQKDNKTDTVEFVNLSTSFEPFGKINRFVADMPLQVKNSAHFVVNIEKIINSNYSLISKSYFSLEKCKGVNHEQLRQRLCELQLNNDKNLNSLLRTFL